MHERRMARWWAVVVLLGGCSSGESSEGTSEASSGGEAQNPTLQDHMAANFDLAASARDGVVAGSLVQAREAALKLAEQDYSVLLPPDWMPAVERMQAAAREVTVASDQAAVAHAVATLASTCGDCHAGFAQGDRGRPVGAPAEHFGEAETMHDRMMRHERALTGFWYGLTIPSDASWQSGAEMLLAAPASPLGKDGKPVSEQMTKDLDAVRALAERARAASATPDRVAVFGEFLAACSSCHTGS